MPRYLITHTLLSSWLYAMRENPYEDLTTETSAMDDFIKTLRREPKETSEAMQNGIEFENLVADILVGHGDRSNSWWDAAKAIADELRGAQLQFVAKKTVNICGDEFLLYGRLDALGAGTITDIKFSKRYDRGKYFNSTQHPMYMFLVPGASRFTYTISNGNEVWHETYRRDETPPIIPIIRDFIGWLRDRDLYDTYKQYWKAAA